MQNMEDRYSIFLFYIIPLDAIPGILIAVLCLDGTTERWKEPVFLMMH